MRYKIILAFIFFSFLLTQLSHQDDIQTPRKVEVQIITSTIPQLGKACDIYAEEISAVKQRLDGVTVHYTAFINHLSLVIDRFDYLPP